MIQHVLRHLRRFIRGTKAVSALEYAILVGVITVAVGMALVTFGDDVAKAVTDIGDGLDKTVGTVADGDDIKPPDPAP